MQVSCEENKNSGECFAKKRKKQKQINKCCPKWTTPTPCKIITTPPPPPHPKQQQNALLLRRPFYLVTDGQSEVTFRLQNQYQHVAMSIALDVVAAE